jgi:hypothetical protein
MTHMSLALMPGADICVVNESKIRDYLLSETHPVGRGKALFFKQRGFCSDDWLRLAAALRAHPRQNPILHTELSTYGQKFTIRCKIETPDGRNPCIVTVWIVEEDEAPRCLVPGFGGADLR